MFRRKSPTPIDIDRRRDVRVDTYRASGAGGQHVNKTDSAIRLTHVPTGIVVQCQNERAQHKNRATAWKMLRRRSHGSKKRNVKPNWPKSTRKRARVLDHRSATTSCTPINAVKDARTKYQMGSFHAVMDGEIQGFLDSTLRWRAGNRSMRTTRTSQRFCRHCMHDSAHVNDVLTRPWAKA